MDGLILIDKPQGMTSHDVVSRVRRAIGQKRVGHFGTLDPLATGLLLVAVGGATRLFPFYSRHDKTYGGEIRLGFSTDTYDAMGKPTSVERRDWPGRDVVAAAMNRFVGPSKQVPPAYSAKKLEGKPLYEWARADRPVQPKASPVNVYSFEMKSYSPPTVTFEARCSAGTYVRSLAHDLGQALACGAHLASLRRLSAGPYGIERAFSLNQVEDLSRTDQNERFLLPLESLLPEFPKTILSAGAGLKLQKGRPIPAAEILRTFPADPAASQPPDAAPICRLFSPQGRFLALARVLEDRDALLPFLLL